MKKTMLALSVFICLSFTIVCGNTHSAKQSPNKQPEVDYRHNHFLDANFELGEILFKTGEVFYQKLNYHLGGNCVSYILDNDIIMIMNNLENVVVVRYANRTFIPISKTEIAEEVKIWDNETSLLLQRQAKITSARGPYGGNTITGSATELSTMPDWGVFDPIEPSNIPAPEILNRFLLLKSGKVHKLQNLKSLRKLYKSKWNQIVAYNKEYEPSFRQQEDMIALLDFLQ